MKFTFVVNRSAGRGRGDSALHFLRARFGHANLEILVDPSVEELRTCCRRLDPAQEVAVVAVGGDGTVNRTLNAIGGRAITLGILPLGRANDLAAEFGIPSDLERACQVLERGTVTPIDLLSVNGTLFATCGGTDIAAAVAARANRWMRGRGPFRMARCLGRGVYVAAAIRELLRPIPDQSFRIGSHKSEHEWHALSLLVSNQPRFGGRFQASPAASNRDGILDICILPRPHGGWSLAKTLRCAWNGRLADIGGATHLTVGEAVITASREVRFFGDGEILAAGRVFRIRAHPEAARVLTPPSGGRR